MNKTNKTQLNRSEKMIAYSAFRLMLKGESVQFSEIVRATFGNIERARIIMKVVNDNIVNYNRLTTKLAKNQYLSCHFTYLVK